MPFRVIKLLWSLLSSLLSICYSLFGCRVVTVTIDRSLLPRSNGSRDQYAILASCDENDVTNKSIKWVFPSLRYYKIAMIHTMISGCLLYSTPTTIVHILGLPSTAARSACSMSHTRSAPSSTPTERRIKSSPIPRIARSAGGILP